LAEETFSNLCPGYTYTDERHIRTFLLRRQQKQILRGSKEFVEEFGEDLNGVFGNKKRPFHPDEKFSIGVDLISNRIHQ
jgi:hypothetical protein